MKKHELNKFVLRKLTSIKVSKSVPNLLVLVVLLLGATNVKSQRFVKPGGSDANDGKTWETAWASLKHAVNNVYSDEPIYFAAGTYTLASGAGTNEAINSTVKQRTNYIIRGGFPTGLAGTKTTGYNPAVNVTQFTGDAILNFRENTGDLDMQGIHFINERHSGALSSPIFTANDVIGTTYKFRDIYLKNCGGSEAGDQGLFKFDDVTNGNIYFDNCVFDTNEMTGVSITGTNHNVNLYIRNSYFKGNDVALNASCIAIRSQHNENVKTYIENNRFCSNRANANGGVILAENTEVFLTNNQFYDNMVDITGQGGGVGYYQDSRLVSTGNTYVGNNTNNQANTDAGAFVFRGNHPNFPIDLSIDGDKYHNNFSNSSYGSSACFGGAIRIGTGAAKSVEIRNSEFVGNKAGRGGAIHSEADILMENCTFQGNQAVSIGGGAIRMENAALSVTGSCFVNNTAKTKGGAIEYEDTTLGQVQYGTVRQIIANTQFFGNSVAGASLVAVGGGALHFDEVRNGISITGSEFYNNTAEVSGILTTRGGGAIRVEGTSAANDDNVTEFTNNKFAGNTRNGSATTGNGGGGSDIKMYYAQMQNITNSVMQLSSQWSYNGDFTWASGNTFGGATVPAVCASITLLTSNCPPVNLEDWFSKPRAVDDIYSVPVRQTINITDILANDFNSSNTEGVNLADGNEAFTVTTQPSNSNITIDAQGNITVGPNTPVGAHTIEYQICGVQVPNGPTPTCSTATVYIEVYPDVDGDGVRDSHDKDNDNDGILDVNEGKCTDRTAATTWAISGGGKTATHTFANGYTVEMTTTSTNNFTTANFSNEDFWSDNANVKNKQGVFNDYSLPSTLTIVFKDASGNPIKVTNPILHIDKIGGETGVNQNSSKLELSATEDLIWNALAGTKDFWVSRKELADGGAGSPKGTGSNDTPNWQANTSTEQDMDGNAAGSVEIVGTAHTFIINVANFELATTDNIGIIISACFDLDTDGDGTPDYLDLDSDNDGCADAFEGGDSIAKTSLVTAAGLLTDGQATPVVNQNLCATYDASTQSSPCANADGIPTAVSATTGQTVGMSTDATKNACDDADGDGIPDHVEIGSDPANPVDTDGDGIPDYKDLDSDNDGIPDSVEAGSNPTSPVDTDGDGVPDYKDLDSDNDGINDIDEAGGTDADGDGMVDNFTDADQDGLHDPLDNQDLPTPVAGTTPVNNGTPHPLPDTDNDGKPNYQDIDSDGDGVYDTTDPTPYGAGSTPPQSQDPSADANGDGIVDDTTDTDGDGIMDSVDGAPNTFGDAIDSDGDGIPDHVEMGGDPANPVDTDGDGIPDYKDLDSDNDGIPDSVEAGSNPQSPVDTDGDGVPDYKDLDSDNDGINDIDEAGGTDADGNGMVDNFTDADKDGLHDPLDNQDLPTPVAGTTPVNNGTPHPLPDTDNDGKPNYQDIDSDGDGVYDTTDPTPYGAGSAPPQSQDPSADANGDGIVDDTTDTDGDGIMDIVDGAPNTFGDAPKDSDGDGIPDHVEVGSDPANPVDTDGDGIPDYKDLDSDNDGIPDSVEAGSNPQSPVDTDGDGVPDYKDLDSDNDGINDIDEAGGTDADGNGMVDNFTDADKDGLHDPLDNQDLPTPVAGTTPVNNGTPHPLPDTDNDGKPNYQDIDSDGDGVYDTTDPTPYGAGSTPPQSQDPSADANGDGVVDDTTDTDGDGIMDIVDGAPNTFGDAPKDSDGDGIPDHVEIGSDPANPVDTDGDGIPDYKDLDSDNDGIPDNVEAGSNPTSPVDTDNDGVPDYKDLDSDNDGKNDIVEAGGTDADGNGMVDSFEDADKDGLHDPLDNQDLPTPVAGTTPVNNGTPLPDTDSDGVPGPDRVTIPTGGTNYTPTDTDGDGIPDTVDVDQTGGTDANGDGIDDSFQTGPDADGDGIADAHDPDKDGDGIIDVVDGAPDTFGDAPLADFSDAPTGYPVLEVSNTYANAFVPTGSNSVWAGNQVSYEVKEKTTTDASGDDYDDGLVVKTLATALGENVVFTVSVNASQTGANAYYELRIDWDNNQSYDETVTGTISTAARVLSSGSEDVSVALPSTYVDGTPVNVRLVVASTAADAAMVSGAFANGEVEDYQFTTSQLLPVELTDFAAVANENDAQLNWSTATELNNSHFMVERSFDGLNFNAITRVEGNGSISSTSNYSYVDVNVGNKAEMVYYRLKQVDFSGEYSYSKVQMVSFGKKLVSDAIYPNPVQVGSSFVVESTNIESIGIFTITGTPVQFLEFDGNTNREEISTSNFASGSYIVVINGSKNKILIIE